MEPELTAEVCELMSTEKEKSEQGLAWLRYRLNELEREIGRIHNAANTRATRIEEDLSAHKSHAWKLMNEHTRTLTDLAGIPEGGPRSIGRVGRLEEKVEENSGRIWKIALMIFGGAISGAGTLAAIQQLF